MAQINGYRDEYQRAGYYPTKPRPREEPHYRRDDHIDQRYGAHPPPNGYRNQRIPSQEYRNGYREEAPRPQRDHREELYSKVKREPPRIAEGYKPYKIETEEIPMKSYELDHLATFTVGPKHGLTSPKDGIQRLRTMQAQAGIWTMRVEMLVEPHDLIILDKQSGEEMERFPLNLVLEPTAVVDQKSRDVYNNCLLFTVKEDTQKTALTEMHIFQVLKKSAQTVVDEILFAKDKVSRSARPNVTNIPSPHIQDRIKMYEEEARVAYDAANRYNPEPQVSRHFQQAMKHPDDTDTVVTERTDRDVQFLNHCFDDIEKFVGRLQQAADSFRELDHRRRGRSDRPRDKTGYRHGDGMLTMRARPPPAKDFIDVFQKFKLSFNLLAKLKPHIHDPNAPELVHFLFTPLSLVVEASKDPRHGTPDLASKVVSPLLTLEAKDLLQNCLTSKEADLWMSLGEAWTVSRDQWKGYVPPFIPRFSDGWQPDPSWMDDTQPHSTMGRSNTRERKPEESYPREEPTQQRYRAEPARDPRDAYYRDERASPVPPPAASNRNREAELREAQRREAEQREWENRQRERELAERAQREREERDRRWAEEQARMNKERMPPVSAPKPSGSQVRDSYEDGQDRFLRELMSKKAKVYEARHAREGKNDKELSVVKGEFLEVLDESRNWWKLRNNKGMEGYAPYTILQAYNVNVNGTSTAPYQSSHIYHHISSPPPQHTTLLTTVVPMMLQPDYASTPRSMNPSMRAASPNRWPQQATVTPAVEEKPISNGDVQNQDTKTSPAGKESAMRSSRNELHNELIKTLHKKKAKTKGQQKGSRFAPIYINQKSNPAEVRAWLDSKSFSSTIQMTLFGQTGAQLFSISKSKLERLFGHEEGSRLCSQITVQKNIAGYSTGKSSELQAILKQQRVKAENSLDDSGIESTNHNTSDGLEAVLNISDISDEK